jgi:hypothetical protein
MTVRQPTCGNGANARIDEEAAMSIKSFGLGDDTEICPVCYALRGTMVYRPPGSRQLCDCEIAQLRTRGQEVPTYGHDLHEAAELCRCCGVDLVLSGSRWAKWFCPECFGRLKVLNEAAGTCVVPIGRHSIMNGVFLKANKDRGPEALNAFADQLLAFFRESGGIQAWGREVVRHNVRTLDLGTAGPIALCTYLLVAQRCLALTKEAAFRRLEAKTGVGKGT